jgi:iron complex transport system permease protein
MRRIRTFADAGPRLALLAGLALLAAAASLLVGPGLGWPELWRFDPGSPAALIVGGLRLPRALVALLAGGCLGASGAVVQGLLRNPLAGPDVMGVSAGSAAGALLLSLAGASFGSWGLALGAWLGAAVCAVVILRLSTARGKTSLTGVVLAGMALSSLLSAVTTLILVLSRETDLARFLFWLSGSLSNRRWEHVAILAPAALTALSVMMISAGRLNVLVLGESTARSLGLRVQRLKIMLLGAVVLATGASVAVCGAIAFIGLLVPHGIRLLWGQDARWFVPLSAMGGALVLETADLAVRLIFSPYEIPVGIVTSLLGAPFFLALLIQRRER